MEILGKILWADESNIKKEGTLILYILFFVQFILIGKREPTNEMKKKFEKKIQSKSLYGNQRSSFT